MANNKITLALIAIILLAACLRFYRLGSNPPAIYWEEAAIGYDAYSILKTGKDWHGNPWPVVAFESFGDWKPSLYFYATVPSVAAFGLTPLAVRLPSAIFGVLTVLLVYFMGLKIGNWKLGIVASILLAVSPWHLQVSRAGFEANLGLFLTVLGYFFPPALALSMYAYHANRLLGPVLFLLLVATKNMKRVWLNAVICLIIALPLIIQFNSPVVRQRLAETSALTSLEPIIKSNQLIEADYSTKWARVVHHRYWQHSQVLLKNYLVHFDLNYLFVKGDINPRHSIQQVGGLYFIQLPLLFWGIYHGRRRPWFKLMLAWLLLAPLPSMLTQAVPHALRSLTMVVPLAVFSSQGMLKLPRSLVWAAGVILIMEFGRYQWLYWHNYPRDYAYFWQAGYKEMVKMVQAREANYDHIYITRAQGRPSIYYWFYTATDPRLVQAMNSEIAKDQGEYLEFGKIKFGARDYLPNSLIVDEHDGKFMFYEN